MSFRDLTIGKKITLGFSVVLALLAAASVLSFTGVEGIVGNAKEVITGNKLDANLTQKEVDHLNWANKICALFTNDKVTSLEVQTDPHKCAFGKWYYGEGRRQAEAQVPTLAPILAKIEAPHTDLHESAVKIKKFYKQADEKLGGFLRQMETAHLAWAHRVKDVFVDETLTEFKNVATNPRTCTFGKWLYGPQVEKLKKEDPQFAAAISTVYEPHEKLHKSAIPIQEMISQGKRQEAAAFYMKSTKPLAYKTLDSIQKVIEWHDNRAKGLYQAQSVFSNDTLPALAKVQSLLNKLREEARRNIMTDEVMLSSAQGTKFTVSLVSGVAIVVGILLSLLIIRGITTVLRRVTEQMDEGAAQVAAASSQVSGASQSLAQGAAEQAASLEETSSSLEEVSSMSRKNAENAQQADNLMKQAEKVVSKAGSSMKELRHAMEQINAASDEMAKIIKTIDEIAFQTNLLALNAAVEAARAGDAGAGFAVVADEVRSLAMRAADAAKNTQQLIEENVTNIKDGTHLVVSTDEAFSEVEESAMKVAELVGEIAAASSEQSQGITQVNQAASDMDQVTQQVAANAEESAASSEELSAQSETLRHMVQTLKTMVDGKGGRRTQAEEPKARRFLPPPKKKGLKGPAPKQAAQLEQPDMDDPDFADF